MFVIMIFGTVALGAIAYLLFVIISIMILHVSDKFLSRRVKMIAVATSDGDIAWLDKDTKISLDKAIQVKEILTKKYPEDNFRICQIQRNWEGEYEIWSDFRI